MNKLDTSYILLIFANYSESWEWEVLLTFYISWSCTTSITHRHSIILNYRRSLDSQKDFWYLALITRQYFHGRRVELSDLSYIEDNKHFQSAFYGLGPPLCQGCPFFLTLHHLACHELHSQCLLSAHIQCRDEKLEAQHLNNFAQGHGVMFWQS